MLRTIYYICNWEYVGRKEQAEIDRQKHLKYLMCGQLKKSKLRLKPVPKTDLFVNKITRNNKKKTGKVYKYC